MQRKIVQQGNFTMMVSLPSTWIKKKNLKKGDTIQIKEFKEDLLISSSLSLREEKKEITISIENPTETSLRVALTNCYRCNYDRITIRIKNILDYNILNKIVKKYLIGFEIMTFEENFTIIENLTEAQSISQESILQKIFFNIEHIISSFLENNVISNIDAVEGQIQSLDNLLRRILFSKQNKEEHIFLTLFQSQLIHAQRELYHCIKKIQEEGGVQLSKEQDLFLRTIFKIFKLIKKMYLSKKDTLEEIHTLYKLKNRDILFSNSEQEISYYLKSSLRQFYLSSSSLYGYQLSNISLN